MIKFFRKIRQKLLAENRFSKYMFYAVGEIMLVVIGILLALQINNWNENRKDRIEENQALIDLKKEIKNYQDYLDRILGHKQIQEDQWRAYLTIITNDTIPLSQRAATERPSRRDPVWGANYMVLNSLLSSAGINNIKNDSLKLKLTNFLSHVERYKASESKFNSRVKDFSDYQNTKVPASLVKEGNHEMRSGLGGDNWPGNYFPNNQAQKVELLMPGLIQDIQYQNYIAGMVSDLYLCIMYGKQVQDNSAQILLFITKELEERNIKY